jgi:hypothetical protein
MMLVTAGRLADADPTLRRHRVIGTRYMPGGELVMDGGTTAQNLILRIF